MNPAGRRDVIVIGASAGGVEALVRLVRRLPPDLDAVVYVVLHVASSGTSVLSSILDRAGPLPAYAAVDGEPVESGRIVVAPPNRHLLVGRTGVRLGQGPRENGHRPAIDPLFRTAAKAFGPRVIGVILSGALDDGTLGLSAIKEAGGLAVVQDPDDALAPSMPQSALRAVDVDFVVPADGIPGLLAQLVTETVADVLPEPRDQPDIADTIVVADPNVAPQTGGLTCPECGGPLTPGEPDGVLRFRCRVDHVFSEESLLDAQSRGVETAPWIAIRSLEERAALLRRTSARLRDRGHEGLAERMGRQAEAADGHAELIRRETVGRADEPIAASEAAER